MKFKKISPMLILIVIASLFIIASSNFQDEKVRNVDNGAQLYHSWDWVLSYKNEIGTQPLWVDNGVSNIETWRCSSCHGWDYLGNYPIGYPSILSAKSMSNDEILEWLDGTRNVDHNFSDYFTVSALREITSFLQNGLIDFSDISLENGNENIIINRNYGEELYKQECTSCHGADGAKINFGTASNPRFIGDVRHETPEKLLHIIRFGHLEIPTGTENIFGWTLSESFSLLGYSEFLPLGRTGGVVVQEEIDYGLQGETTEIVYLSIFLVIIVFSSITINNIKERNKS